MHHPDRPRIVQDPTMPVGSDVQIQINYDSIVCDCCEAPIEYCEVLDETGWGEQVTIAVMYEYRTRMGRTWSGWSTSKMVVEFERSEGVDNA